MAYRCCRNNPVVVVVASDKSTPGIVAASDSSFNYVTTVSNFYAVIYIDTYTVVAYGASVSNYSDGVGVSACTSVADVSVSASVSTVAYFDAVVSVSIFASYSVYIDYYGVDSISAPSSDIYIFTLTDYSDCSSFYTVDFVDPSTVVYAL